MQTKSSPIAIVGIGCLYPGAGNYSYFWENILARRQQFREFPDCRLPLSDYHDPSKSAPDKTYGKRAALIDGYNFDWANKKIPKSAFEATDIVHWLALDTALNALDQARFKLDEMPKDKTGVIVGNTLTGEFTRSNTMRLRWPYIQRVFRTMANDKGWKDSVIAEWESEMEMLYKSVFAPISEDTLAGGLANTIAGRVANFCDFHGGGYIVDGACSSSLLAVITAANALSIGDMDIALAGGVDISLDTFELIGFAKTGALTPDTMKVYDSQGNGFIPGEGCGFTVLKRLEDAQRDGDNILAVLNGWGISSDGKGGITAPSINGQANALIRAYQKAGYSPAQLDFIEGHGTGTTVGDRVELSGIIEAFNYFDAKPKKNCGITSLKSIVGHTKAAAGIGAFIKTVIALNERVIPPTAGIKTSHPLFSTKEGQIIYPLSRGKTLAENASLTAGVSAMGFGGINSHVTLTSGETKIPLFDSNLTSSQLMASLQDSEVIALSAPSLDQLLKDIADLTETVRGMSSADTLDLAASINFQANPAHLWKVSLTVYHPDELTNFLMTLITKLSDTPLAEGEIYTSPCKKCVVSHGARTPKIGFLFPGQGSQSLQMTHFLIERFSWAKEMSQQAMLASRPDLLEIIYKNPDQAIDADELKTWLTTLSETDVAQPAITLSSQLWAHFLHNIGITPDCVAGHSLGELSAFHASGMINQNMLFDVAAKRGHAMASTKEKGLMISLNTDISTVQELIEDCDEVVIANHNSPSQVVISGSRNGIDTVIKRAESKAIGVYRLPVSNAFHSPFVQSAREEVSQISALQTSANIKKPLYSTVTAKKIASVDSLADYFAQQITSPVQFMETIQAMAVDVDLFVEVGPGRILTGLVSAITEDNTPCFPVEVSPSNFSSINTLIGQLFVRGISIQWDQLYQYRLVRPFVSANEKSFLVNPLERPFANEIAGKKATSTALEGVHNNRIDSLQEADSTTTNEDDSLPGNTPVLDQLIKLISDKTGFSISSISSEMRLLDDLNLDSIKAGELLATLANRLGIMGQLDVTQYANTSLAEICLAIEQIDRHDASSKSKPVNWVRSFVRHWVDSTASLHSEPSGSPVVITSSETFDHIRSSQGDHLIIILPETHRSIEQCRKRHDLMIQLVTFLKNGHGNIHQISVIEPTLTAPFPLSAFLASCHLEKTNLTFHVIETDPLSQDALVSIARKEMAMDAKTTFHYVRYQDECRYLPQIAVDHPYQQSVSSVEWKTNDVVLITGGAKGITAECAFAFAKSTLVKVALVGSSPYDDTHPNLEIEKTLLKFEAAKLTAHYFSCDISNLSTVKQMIGAIEASLGSITGVIHGAGKNIPQSIKDVTSDVTWDEIQPKLIGAMNLTEALPLDQLKCWIALSSIIGTTGMVGNAWYAFSNESLDRLTQFVSQQNPRCHAISLAYSVWAETGMGVRMGSESSLESMGIGAMPTQEAVDYFLTYALGKYPLDHVVIASRLGGLDTWPIPKLSIPATNRFIESIISLDPEVACTVEAKLSHETDQYLQDHNFNGTMLFPTVFGLEAMAQVVALLTGRNEMPELSIEDIQLKKPIVVDEKEGITIRITALTQTRRGNEEKIDIEILTEPTGYSEAFFSATFVFHSESSSIKFAQLPDYTSALEISPKRHLYGQLLFQGTAFQRLRTLYQLTSKEIIFDVDITDRKTSPAYLLGCPYERDALLQSIQIVKSDSLYLPVSIEELHINQHYSSANIAHAVLEEVHEDYLIGSVTYQGPNGRQELRRYKAANTHQATGYLAPEDLCDPHKRFDFMLNQELASLRHWYDFELPQLIYRYIEGFKTLKKEARHQHYASILFEKGLIEEISQLSFLDTGKPMLTNGQQLSITNKGCHVILCVSDQATGCDLEIIEARQDDVWAQLLGDIEGIEDLTDLTDFEKTKIWCGAEIGVKGETPLADLSFVNKLRKDAFYLNNNLPIICFQDIIANHVFTVTAQNFVNKSGYHKSTNSEDSLIILNEDQTLTSFTAVGPQGQEMFVHRFRLTFKETVGFSRLPYFNIFAHWMGKLRELPMKPAEENLIPELESGLWGMVTNNSSIEVLGTAKALDLIEGRIWISKVYGKYNTSFDLTYDWHKIASDGTKTRLAITYLSSTWVKVLERGIVEISPYPDYLIDLMARMSPQNNNPDTFEPLQTEFNNVDLGKPVFSSNTAPSHYPLVFEQQFITSFEDSNLVGNVYFAKYYDWQAKSRDLYLFSIFRDHYLQVASTKEFISINADVHHLREAMPFDTIVVRVYISEIFEKAINFYFEYYKQSEDQLEKLAYGTHSTVWIEKTLDKVTPINIPSSLIKKLVEMAFKGKVSTTQNAIERGPINQELS